MNYTADVRGDLIFDGFEPQPSAPHCHDGHDLALQPDSALEATHQPAPTLDSEPAAQIEDGWLDTASGAATSTSIQPNIDLVPHEARDSEVPDSLPDSEPPAPPPIESDWAPIMEFTAADIFQHSPFGDILKSLKSLSLSGEPWPDYGQQGWGTDDEEIQSPPTTHFVATVDDLTDMLDFDSEDIDGMDADEGDNEEPAPIRPWKATSSYDIYMVDTPKEGEGDGTAEDDPSKKQPKRQRQRRRSKSHQHKNGDSSTGDNNTPESAGENPLQQDLA